MKFWTYRPGILSNYKVWIKLAIEEAILDGLIPNEYEPAYNYMLKIKDEFLDT